MTTLHSCAKMISQLHRLIPITCSGQRGFKRWVAPVKKFDSELLVQALTHRSYVIQEEQKQRDVGITEPKLDIEDNREMIEEGAELTSRIVVSYLGKCLPLAPEECIFALHDHLLSQKTLAHVSSHIGTKDIILVAGNIADEGILADTFLALVSALTRSVDVIHAGAFVRDFLIATLAEKDLIEIWTPSNPLENLNEILRKDNRQLAEPRLISQTGINSLIPVYRVAVYSNKEFLGVGCGETIDVAKEVAATDALLRIFNLNNYQNLKYDLKVDISKDNMENLPLTKWCTENVQKVLQLKT
ncbi:39S ribosomal protein L44, mitochondrial isoform X2 [Cephus cinctus]|uniref:Large ribosomal subunit protein mL44 n=1 Tax=Cephus cinctus TaxID=211228 RepID=A0AAJ7FIJ7_CEPCN|nr:39S ribosomal protein L44, mitochondrial isoform X2 [Cephus cinctus]